MVLLFDPPTDGFSADLVTILSGNGLRGNAMFIGSVRMGTMLK